MNSKNSEHFGTVFGTNMEHLLVTNCNLTTWLRQRPEVSVPTHSLCLVTKQQLLLNMKGQRPFKKLKDSIIRTLKESLDKVNTKATFVIKT